MRRSFSQVTVLLSIGALAGGIGVLLLSTRAMGLPHGWHGALLGVCVGVYGLCAFGLGMHWHARARPNGASAGGNGPHADDAKFWLRKFLEEQQKNGRKTYG